VTDAPKPWAALRKRLGRPDAPDATHEWFMPLEDRAGIVAWRTWASAVHAAYVPETKETGVAWEFPVLAAMKKSLERAESLFRHEPRNALLGRVVRDLRSYRDHGCSSMSPDHPKRETLGLDKPHRPRNRPLARKKTGS
jgi:hypothetical protein